MRQLEESGTRRTDGSRWVLLVAMLGGLPVLAQPLVPPTAFLENENPVGEATAAALWRSAVDPDASRVLVAEGEGGLVHYALDGSDPQRLLPVQEVRGLALTHGGGALEEGQALVASVAPDDDSLIFHVLEFNEGGAPSPVSYHSATRDGGGAQGYGSAQSLAFTTDAEGRLFLFVSLPNEVEQLEIELTDQGLTWTRVALRPLTGSASMLASDASGSFLFAAVEESGIAWVTTDPGDEAVFTLVFSSLDVLSPDGMTMDTRRAPVGVPAYLLTGNSVDSTLRVFEPLINPPRFVGSFRIDSGQGQTPSPVSGLALTTEPVGSLFPEGLLIVTTGVPGERRGALVSWGDVARSFTPPLHFVEEGTGGDGDGGTGGDGGTDGGIDGGSNQPVPGGPDIALPQLPRDEVGCGCTGAGSLSTVSLLLGSWLLLMRRRRR